MSYQGTSIVDFLTSTGKSSDFASRAKLAASNGIAGYTGSAQQNAQLLGILNKPATPAVPVTPTASSPFFAPPTMSPMPTGNANSTPAFSQPVTPSVSASGVPSMLPPKPTSSPIMSLNGGPQPKTPVIAGNSSSSMLSAIPISPSAPKIAPVAPKPVTPTVSMSKPVTPTVTPPIAPKAPVMPVTPTTSSGLAINPKTGGVSDQPPVPSQTPVPPVTETKPMPNAEYEAAVKAYEANLALTPEEIANQEAINALEGNAALGTANISNQAIPLDFITGQNAALEKRRLALEQPLQAKAALLQAKRTAALEASKFKLGLESDKLKTAQEASKPISVSAGSTLVNPVTGKAVYTAPKEPTKRDTSITEVNGRRLIVDNQTGQTIVDLGPVKGEGSGDRQLTVTEAQALGVPFGTMASQAVGTTIQKPMTESQGRDYTYGTRAGEANTILDDMQSTVAGYNSAAWLAAKAAENTTLGNAFVPDDVKQIRQAERNFMTAILRRESGAQISPSEFDTGEKLYFPRPGDDAKTLEQKAQARQTAIDSIMKASGVKPTTTSYSGITSTGLKYIVLP